MNKKRPLVSIARMGVSVFALFAATDGLPAQHTDICPYYVWLGPQKNTGRVIDANGQAQSEAVVESDQYSVGKVWGHVKDHMDIELRVAIGSTVKLPNTENGYTTIINGEVASVFPLPSDLLKEPLPKLKYGSEVGGFPPLTTLPIDPNASYVLAVVRQQGNLKRYHTINVRINHGRLSGALVHLRDGTTPESLQDPYVAIYKIPKHVEVAEGILEYEMARIVGK